MEKDSNLRWECTSGMCRPFLNTFLGGGGLNEPLEDYTCTVGIGGRKVSNLCFAGDIVGLGDSGEELTTRTGRRNQTDEIYGMEINADK